MTCPSAVFGSVLTCSSCASSCSQYFFSVGRYIFVIALLRLLLRPIIFLPKRSPLHNTLCNHNIHPKCYAATLLVKPVARDGVILPDSVLAGSACPRADEVSRIPAKLGETV